MLSFNVEHFLQMLQTAPETRPFLEPAEYSEYLQSQVFDRLKRQGQVDLLKLDWDELPPCRAFMPYYRELYENVDAGWTKGVNHFIHKTPAAPLTDRSFF